MGVAYYIALEKDDEEVCTEVDGKTLARSEKELNKVAASLGLKKLEEFFGASEDMLEEFDVENTEAGPWFEPQEGLTWVEKIIQHLSSNPNLIKNQNRVVEELRDVERALKKALEKNTRWHFAIDF